MLPQANHFVLPGGRRAALLPSGRRLGLGRVAMPNGQSGERGGEPSDSDPSRSRSRSRSRHRHIHRGKGHHCSECYQAYDAYQQGRLQGGNDKLVYLKGIQHPYAKGYEDGHWEGTNTAQKAAYQNGYENGVKGYQQVWA